MLTIRVYKTFVKKKKKISNNNNIVTLCGCIEMYMISNDNSNNLSVNNYFAVTKTDDSLTNNILMFRTTVVHVQ